MNSDKDVDGAHDTDENLSAMRGIFAAAIRASELLGQDAALRAEWRELLANLAPLPTSAHPDALRAADYTGAPVFVRGLKPTANNNTGFTPDGNSLPMWFFDLVNLESPDKQMLAAANATLNRTTYRAGIGPTTAVGVLSKWAIGEAGRWAARTPRASSCRNSISRVRGRAADPRISADGRSSIA